MADEINPVVLTVCNDALPNVAELTEYIVFVFILELYIVFVIMVLVLRRFVEILLK